MRIDYVELENIKSYHAPTRIELTEGVNAICGHNGSGKTTVLEAMGYALFGSHQYAQSDFVREGEKSGTICVGLRDRDDRRYEVTRRIGSRAFHAVIDAETRTRIADSKEVFDWIRSQALQLEGEISLAALFENAVGVPQGKMTSDFLGTPTARKSIFDPLLRVEEYGNAYVQLRETLTFLRERTALEDQAIAGLRTDTDRIPDAVSRIDQLGQELTDCRLLLQRLVGEAKQLRAQCKELEDLHSRLLLAQDEVRGAQYEVKRAVDLEQQRRDAVTAAEQAAEHVRLSEPGYHQVCDARARLASWEQLRLERDELTTKQASAQTEVRGIFGQIEQLDLELQSSRDAAISAANLEMEVSRQRLLEDELRELEVGLRDLTRLEAELATLREEIRRGEQHQVVLERQLAEAIEAETLAGGLKPAEEALDALRRELAELPALRNERDRIRQEGARLKKERSRLVEEMNQWRVAEERRRSLEVQATSVDALQARLGDVREQWAVLDATLTYQEYARNQLAAGNCPLVGQQCPVVTANPAVLLRLDSDDVIVAEKRENIEHDLRQISQDLEEARQAAAEYQGLLLTMSTLKHDDADLAAIEDDLRTCNVQFQQVTSSLGRETQLRAQEETLLQQMEELLAAGRKAAQRPVLETQRLRDTEALERAAQRLETTVAQHAALSATRQRAALLTQEVAALGDPHRRQQELLVLAGRRDRIERELSERQVQMVEASGRVKALSARLEEFSRFDEEVALERERERSAMEAYELYLQHVGIANQLTERQVALGAQSLQREQAESVLNEMTLRRDALQAGYDGEHHRELQLAADAADREAVKQEAGVHHLEVTLKEAEDELDMLRRKEETLGRHLAERGLLADTERAVTFIRDTVKAAGPAITEALLYTISQTANDIYAEIINDHAIELRWDRDYEILIQHGPDKRKFAQLSGGEQMGAALAVRLALLKEMSEVDFAFFDEPTQNMDSERRSNLADQIRQIRGFNQLIVISHDDTFEHHTDTVIRLEKLHGETTVESDAGSG